MKYALALMAFIIGAQANAAEFLEFRDENFDPRSVEDKNWQFNFGVEYLRYPTVLPAFQGTHEKIEKEEKYDVYGVGLAFGREFDLFGGLSTVWKLGGFYSKTLETTRGKAAQGEDLELANVRTNHMVYGGEATASLNYLFDNKVIDVQPFVEFGLGTGIANIEKEYVFEGIQPDRSDAEDYDIRTEENFNYAKTSIGINFIGLEGVAFYIKATNMILNISKRKITGFDGSKKRDDSSQPDETKSLLSASLGVGYLF